MKDNKVKFDMQLNSVEQDVNDPTLLNATWILHGFKISGNRSILSKEVSLEASSTLLNKPIVTNYKPVTMSNTDTDALGDHEIDLNENRYGEEVEITNTTPIGTIVTEGYIMTITNAQGDEEEVLACDSVLWRSRFPDACDLLIEWYEKGIAILSSCEYYYSNFLLEDGIIYIQSPIYYDGHCILNSEERGEHKLVKPAYEESVLLSLNQLNTFENLVTKALNQQHNETNNNTKGEDSMSKKDKLFRKVCELSHSDVRSSLYKNLKEIMSEEEYSYSFIYDVYDGHVVVEQYEEEDCTTYDYAYTKNDENDTVTIDLESKKEVKLKREWVDVDEIIQMEQSLNEANDSVEKLTKEINEQKENKEALVSEKNTLSETISEATEKITSLSKEVNSLKEYKEKYDKNAYEKALNEKLDFYEGKFKAVNAKEKFNDEEVQELIKTSISGKTEGEKATMSLNSMLIDMVQVEEKSDNDKLIKETCSAEKALIIADNSFDSKYK